MGRLSQQATWSEDQTWIAVVSGWCLTMTMSSLCVGKSRGWYPRESLKGEMLVAELVRELWAYLTQARCVFQVEGLLAEIQHRVASRPWLAHSI